MFFTSPANGSFSPANGFLRLRRESRAGAARRSSAQDERSSRFTHRTRHLTPPRRCSTLTISCTYRRTPCLKPSLWTSITTCARTSKMARMATSRSCPPRRSSPSSSTARAARSAARSACSPKTDTCRRSRARACASYAIPPSPTPRATTASRPSTSSRGAAAL